MQTNTTNQGRAAYSAEEFAALFGKSKTWAYRRIYAGDVKILRGLGTLMIPVGEVERLQSLAAPLQTRVRQRKSDKIKAR